VTTWDARQKKSRSADRSADRDKILCGFTVENRYCCVEIVAHKALWSADDEHDLPGPDELWLPVGLTDDGTPGEYRWSQYAADRIKRYESPSVGRGGGATRAVRLGSGAIVVPCRKGHRNRVDAGTLSR